MISVRRTSVVPIFEVSISGKLSQDRISVIDLDWKAYENSVSSHVKGFIRASDA